MCVLSQQKALVNCAFSFVLFFSPNFYFSSIKTQASMYICVCALESITKYVI